jgi:hypothetical protein
VIDFPTGQDRLQLSVIVSPEFRADPRQKEYKVAEWFTAGGKNAKGNLVSANPRLRQIQEACAYRYVNSNDPNFAQTARVELLGNADLPIVMLTGPDGKIKRDGSGGLLMYGTDLQGINSADDMADYLIAAAEKFNQKPDLVGLVNTLLAPTPTIAIPAGHCPNCGKYTAGAPCPDCTPDLPKPQPNGGTIQPRLISIKPNPAKYIDRAFALSIGIASVFVIAPLGGLALYLRFRRKP